MGRMVWYRLWSFYTVPFLANDTLGHLVENTYQQFEIALLSFAFDLSMLPPSYVKNEKLIMHGWIADFSVQLRKFGLKKIPFYSENLILINIKTKTFLFCFVIVIKINFLTFKLKYVRFFSLLKWNFHDMFCHLCLSRAIAPNC